ncbi:hypothetical protein HGH92_27905 [Chitinophaga varians]|uniref:Magnesium citrate secondary transporter n=1 Tax=Chitinophaga varians TaxID=2202339 RepID=A0A847RYL8_9BACT|nr:hypothetical protein [Chitinophaga varians]NLR68162.1 hypothetical protein [Chitinophaga varians]
MKRLFYILGISGLSWLMVHLARWSGHPLPWLNGHLTDLIVVPLIAQACLVVVQRWIVKRSDYLLPLGYVLFIACYVAVVFEWIMPRYSPRYTGDWLDVAAYFAGAAGYYGWQHWPVALHGTNGEGYR